MAITEQEVITNSEAKEDRVSKTRTIYDAGTLEIFWKNFIAGMSRAIGSLFIYLIIFVVSGIIFANFFLPKILPLIESYTNLLNSFGSVQNIKTPQNVIPQDLLQQFNNLK